VACSCCRFFFSFFVWTIFLFSFFVGQFFLLAADFCFPFSLADFFPFFSSRGQFSFCRVMIFLDG